MRDTSTSGSACNSTTRATDSSFLRNLAPKDSPKSASTFFQQARIVRHHQVTVDFLNQIEGDTDGDQQASAAEKAGDLIVDVDDPRDDRGRDRHERQETRPHVRDTDHDLFQV